MTVVRQITSRVSISKEKRVPIIFRHRKVDSFGIHEAYVFRFAMVD